MADTVTPSVSVTMKMMVSRRDLQFNVVTNLWWALGILEFFIFLFLAEMKAVCRKICT
jgi:hypothetical protein